MRAAAIAVLCSVAAASVACGSSHEGEGSGSVNAVPLARPADATLAETFTGKPDGAFSIADTGQTWLRTGTEPLVVSGGTMALPGNAVGAGYTTATLPHAPVLIGATVTFAAGKVGGVAVLLASGGRQLDLYSVGLHYVFDVGGWVLQVRSHGRQILPVIASGRYRHPLRADGKTRYSVQVSIVDGDKAVMRNADGSTHSVVDSRIRQNTGPVAFEVYRTGNDQLRPAFTEVWAR